MLNHNQVKKCYLNAAGANIYPLTASSSSHPQEKHAGKFALFQGSQNLFGHMPMMKCLECFSFKHRCAISSWSHWQQGMTDRKLSRQAGSIKPGRLCAHFQPIGDNKTSDSSLNQIFIRNKVVFITLLLYLIKNKHLSNSIHLYYTTWISISSLLTIPAMRFAL
jgi:hypothetical protein